jgi:hypothetical protein
MMSTATVVSAGTQWQRLGFPDQTTVTIADTGSDTTAAFGVGQAYYAGATSGNADGALVAFFVFSFTEAAVDSVTTQVEYNFGDNVWKPAAAAVKAPYASGRWHVVAIDASAPCVSARLIITESDGSGAASALTSTTCYGVYWRE